MIRLKRLSDPALSDDGCRVLVTHYRPHGVRKGLESWDEWRKELAPSAELYRAWFGLRVVDGKEVGKPMPGSISWQTYRRRFRKEMQESSAKRTQVLLAARALGGKRVTLLCACKQEGRCHHRVVKEMIEAIVAEVAE